MIKKKAAMIKMMMKITRKRRKNRNQKALPDPSIVMRMTMKMMMTSMLGEKNQGESEGRMMILIDKKDMNWEWITWNM